MIKSPAIIALFLCSSLSANMLMAADVPQQASTAAPAKLETIDSRGQDECPMHQNKQKCDHEKGKPCEHDKHHTHKEHAHEKCEHEHGKHAH